MLGFIVPVKPKEYSKNWAFDNLLLARTVRSICNQEDDDFKIIIVYTDKPEINFTHRNLHYLHFPFSMVNHYELTDWEERRKWHSPEVAERMMDKGRKIALGCQKAKELHCNYLMGVDSDDLVSSKLGTFVNNRTVANCAGWRINNGYLYEEDAFLAIKNDRIWFINGSTHIIRADLVNVPDLENDFSFRSFSLFENHAWTLQRILDIHKEILQPVPFYGVIYLVHKNNYSTINKFVSGMPVRLLAKKLLKGKIVDQKMRKEFGLYRLVTGV
jgi:glycosyltransferase involved in cell wall biosynthesis